MNSRIANRLRFILERWIQGGAWNQLLLTASIIGFIAVIGGTLAFALSGTFTEYSDAVWWSFLRLSDPGYLGDDEGAVLRTIATVITILGYVLFLGSLIAIMTQWLNSTIRRLESGLSPITVSGHTIILGWTNRTPSLLRELVAGETSLPPRQRRHRRLVILASEVTPELRRELRDVLGDAYDRWRIILRSGSQLRVEHLRRVDFEHASTIVLPGSDFSLGGYEASDARIIKTLLTIAHHIDGAARPTDKPQIVAEILDPSRMTAVNRAYDGPIETVSSNVLISRIIAQTIRNPGLSKFYSELFSHAVGNELYAERFPVLAGDSFANAASRFDDAILLGIVRTTGSEWSAHLNPPGDLHIGEDDYCIGIAKSRRAFVPGDRPLAEPQVQPLIAASPTTRTTHRILVLGWNHRFPQLITELGSYSNESFHVDVLAPVPVEEREVDVTTQNKVTIVHHRGDSSEDIVLRRLDLASYTSILQLGNSWMTSGDESDAQTLMDMLLLNSLLPSGSTRPHVLVELMNPETASLISDDSESFVSPVLVSNVLAHVTLRPELNAALTSLFAPDGPQIRFVKADLMGLAGQRMSFGELSHRVSLSGDICIGIRTPAGTALNPPRDRVWEFNGREDIVVLGAMSGRGTAS
jgi:ion channel POLLUX/CASTOR